MPVHKYAVLSDNRICFEQIRLGFVVTGSEIQQVRNKNFARVLHELTPTNGQLPDESVFRGVDLLRMLFVCVFSPVSGL